MLANACQGFVSRVGVRVLTDLHLQRTASRGEQATVIQPEGGAWSAQQKDGKIGTERHNILHTLRMGRDWPVKPTNRPESLVVAA